MKKTIQALLSVLLLSTFLISTSSVAAPVQISITGSWTAEDFTVTDSGDPLFDLMNPSYDGTVFGVTPSDGSITIDLLVETDTAVSYSAGYTYDYLGTDYTLSHDFYGYSDVSLLSSTFTFGTATWNTTGILDGLVGPDSVEAALWTNTDISATAPSLLSFRMFGSSDGLTADIFFGSRTPSSIGSQFLLWEYYAGEEIRSDQYSASIETGPAPVPEPSTILLLGGGLAGLAFYRRKRK